MNYPFWDQPVGYGVLMALIAVFHVFVSHFAIGGGLYLVVSEVYARRAKDEQRLEFLQGLSKFFVLATLVAGALTGVGIWFVIGLLNPAATEALIHNYVWGWATEWTFFVVEIAAAILYYHGWKSMRPRDHVIVGWIYFVFAWLSLFVINGIITFMLTPGRWLETGDFWDGFFNPTFWPSLFLRTGVCLMLACLYALLVVSRYEPSDFKARTVRYAATWGLGGLLLMGLGQYWYWMSIPSAVVAKALLTMPTPIRALRHSACMAACTAVLLIGFGWIAPRRLSLVPAVVLMALGLGWFGSFEWFRESMRKPYIISGYMYGNGVEVSKTDRYQKEGYLSQLAYRSGDDARDLFQHSCRTCHTLRGYKPLGPAFDGMDQPFIAAIIRSAHLLRGNMPPFLGTAPEADEIANYLSRHTDRRPLAEICKGSGAPLGKKAYEMRCGKCHALGTAADKTPGFAGKSDDDVNMLLDNAADLGQGMTAYTGDATERAALVEFLLHPTKE